MREFSPSPEIYRPNIIGNGDVASALRELDSTGNKLFFASGVSNSRENRQSEFEREKELLLSQEKDRRLVYFGSMSIFYANTQYAQHKRNMEAVVKQNFPAYNIVRIGNITWGNNPNTLINYFRGQVKRGEPLQIQDTYRYVVDKEEFLYWMSMIPDWNCEMNITGTRMSIKQIVDRYVYI